jgi:ribosomal protein S27E
MMSKFMKVKCECGTERMVFGNSASEIKCDKCGAALVHPRGGVAIIHGETVEEYE